MKKLLKKIVSDLTLTNPTDPLVRTDAAWILRQIIDEITRRETEAVAEQERRKERRAELFEEAESWDRKKTEAILEDELKEDVEGDVFP